MNLALEPRKEPLEIGFRPIHAFNYNVTDATQSYEIFNSVILRSFIDMMHQNMYRVFADFATFMVTAKNYISKTTKIMFVYPFKSIYSALFNIFVIPFLPIKSLPKSTLLAKPCFIIVSLVTRCANTFTKLNIIEMSFSSFSFVSTFFTMLTGKKFSSITTRTKSFGDVSFLATLARFIGSIHRTIIALIVKKVKENIS